MNIKEAEALSGVTRQNIRFYECEGIILPARNPENDYREYSQEDIAVLKRIRLLRMLDMPLEQVRLVLSGQISLQDALTAQKTRLQEQADHLETAIAFCDTLCRQGSMENVDVLLSRMDEPEVQKKLPASWMGDYKKVALSERQKAFTFIPEEAVTTAREFTLVLCRYAEREKLDLVIIREGMYPEFTIDGIAYTAERFYTSVNGFPVATIRCVVKHPEDFEPDVPKGRKRFLKWIHYGWAMIPLLILVTVTLIQSDLTAWETWVLLLFEVVLMISYLFYFIPLHYNENGKSNR